MDTKHTREKQTGTAASRTKGFLAAAGHELRNPLHTLSGYVDMVLDEMAGPLTPTQREFLGYVQSSAERLRLLVEDVLLLARADAGELALHLKQLDIGDVVAECAAETSSAGSATVLVPSRARAEPAHRVRADHERLKLALSRLFETCSRISGEPSNMRVVQSRDPYGIRISVHLPATRIHEHELAIIFQRFAQVHSPDTGLPLDLGLGLAVCDTIVHLHGGMMEAARGEELDALILSVTLPAPRPQP